MSNRRIRGIRNSTKKQIRHALSRYTRDRNYLIDGEMITPAEDWLLRMIKSFSPVEKHSEQRVKIRLIEMAKVLELYPIPDWWIVRKRVIESMPKQGVTNEASV